MIDQNLQNRIKVPNLPSDEVLDEVLRQLNAAKSEDKEASKSSKEEKVRVPKAEKDGVSKFPKIKLGKVSVFLENNSKIIGFIFILLSLFLLISIVSYFFTGKDDQSLIDNSIIDFHSKVGDSNNWMGRMGAFFSELLVKKMFGLASILLVAYLFFSGLHKVKPMKEKMKLQITYFTLIGTLYFSILLGFLFKSISSLDFLGGTFGFTFQEIIRNYIGSPGLLILLLIPIVIYLWKNLKSLLALWESRVKISKPLNENGTENDSKIDNEVLENRPKFSKESVVNQDNNGNIQYANANQPNQKTRENILSEELDNIKSLAINKLNGKGHKSSEEVLRDIENAFHLENKTNQAPEVPVPKKKAEIGFEVNINNGVIKIDENKSLSNQEDERINNRSLYQFPTLALLRNHGSGILQIDNEELELKKHQIIETLSHFKIQIASIKATVGPTVTLYEVVPAPGVKISKIKGLVDDIALSLSALGIRIIAPMPGKGTIGIEVPNKKREIVSLKEALASDAFANSTFDLPIVLGKTINNDVYVADLARMPHLLMAGATGQGKSVGINTIISSILFKKHPADVKFVLVDPKKVELNLYKKIEKHFLPILPDGQEAIITDTKLVVDVLKSLCVEMDNRYENLKEAGVRNLKEYNIKIQKGELDSNHVRLPYIILVIDELADLMMTAGKEVEMPIARLAQLARAIGIHLIVATQRPSVNIITGSIKANFPARLAFKVTSKIDSRTILDTGGADQLVGMGDMLFSNGNDIVRLQCPFIDTDEVEKLNEHISLQPYPEEFKLKIYSSEDGDSGGDFGSFNGDIDPMFEEAARLIVSTQQGSTSLIQRRMKLGYNRAGRIMDQLEKCSIVGPAEGSKPREVLVSDDYILDQYLSKILK